MNHNTVPHQGSTRFLKAFEECIGWKVFVGLKVEEEVVVQGRSVRHIFPVEQFQFAFKARGVTVVWEGSHIGVVDPRESMFVEARGSILVDENVKVGSTC